MLHQSKFRPRCAHSEILICSLQICSCMFHIVFVMMARLPAQAFILHVVVEVLIRYSRLVFSNHCKSGSRKMMKRYRMSVSPCIIPVLSRLVVGHQSGCHGKRWWNLIRCHRLVPLHLWGNLGLPLGRAIQCDQLSQIRFQSQSMQSKYHFMWGGVSLRSKPFLTQMQRFVFSIVACKEGREDTSINLVDSVD